MESPKEPASNYEPFRLKEKIGEMIQYGRPLVKNFPRKDRDLSDDIRSAMNRMYHLVVEIERKYFRKTTTQELDIELEWMRLLIRMAANKDANGRFPPPLSQHQYEVWSRYMSEIGKLLGKYIKSLNK